MTSELLSNVLKIGGGSVLVGIGAVVATPLVIAGLGFGTTGVASGSIGAYMMSGVGNVAAGSTIALLQSAGVLGVSALTNTIIGTTVGGVVASISIPYFKISK